MSSNEIDTTSRSGDRSGPPRIHGYLHRRGYFGDWRRRFVELQADGLYYGLTQEGRRWGSTPLSVGTKCEDSSLRHFCFCLTQPDGRRTYFAAPNIAVKEAWLEHIQGRLSDLRIQERRVRRLQRSLASAVQAVGAFRAAGAGKTGRTAATAGGNDSDYAGGHSDGHSSMGLSEVGDYDHQVQYQARPMIYVKVVRARGLLGKDSMMENLKGGNVRGIGGKGKGNMSDPYVKVCLGAATARTITRRKELNPEWGMVFPFPWDASMRFAKVEVWDEDTTTGSDHFLGQVMLPVFHLKNGDSSIAWVRVG